MSIAVTMVKPSMVLPTNVDGCYHEYHWRAQLGLKDQTVTWDIVGNWNLHTRGRGGQAGQGIITIGKKTLIEKEHLQSVFFTALLLVCSIINIGQLMMIEEMRCKMFNTSPNWIHPNFNLDFLRVSALEFLAHVFRIGRKKKTLRLISWSIVANQQNVPTQHWCWCNIYIINIQYVHWHWNLLVRQQIWLLLCLDGGRK